MSETRPDVKAAPDRAAKRRKLWEIRQNYHCSIIGTCLTLAELKKIIRKSRLIIPEASTEYEIHATFVCIAGRQDSTAKAVQKHLDAKYRKSILLYSKARTDEDLLHQWNQSLSAGDIPGPYWAVMSHPSASSALLSQVFGEVHMFSHLIGASNRTDIRRLKELDCKRIELQEELNAAKNLFRERIAERDASIDDLERHLCRAQRAQRALEAAQVRILELESGEDTERFREQAVKLQQAVERERTRSERAERRAAHLERALKKREKETEKMRALVEDSKSECAFMEEEFKRLLEALDPESCEACGTDQCPCPQLSGRKILYVGGRTGLIKHYRALVERHGGKFLHHDGGLENSKSRLDHILFQADTVLCPVDCVSHDACQRVKTICKQRSKSFVPLRSSGLSSLARSLSQIVHHRAVSAKLGSPGFVN